MNNPSNLKNLTLLLFISLCFTCYSQEDEYNGWRLGAFAGGINYQGDLQPSSFTFQSSKFGLAVTARKPLGRWLSFKSGFSLGRVEALDKNNRDYLKERNLSFYTSIKEFNAGLELNILDITTKHFTPYLFGGFSVFYFKPWTYDAQGGKTFLQALGTEGQGLEQYPDRKPYKLVQPALAFSAGARFAISENVNIGLEFSQRKTFFDYLDDVSTTYVDQSLLLNARGPKAVELAYRGDEIPGGRPYPHDGEKRGTPSEMDWFYFFGLTVEIKMSKLGAVLPSNRSSLIYTRCPRLK